MCAIDALVKFAAKLEAGKVEVTKDEVRKVARKLGEAFTLDRREVLQVRSRTLAELLSLVPKVKSEPAFAFGLAAPDLAVEPLNALLSEIGLPVLKAEEVEILLYAVNDLSESSLSKLATAKSLFA